MAKPSSPRASKSARSRAPSVRAGSSADAATAPRDDALPDKGTIDALLLRLRAFMANERHARVRSHLERLAEHPPQALLLEGGGAEDRLDAAHYWMLLLNCQTGASPRKTLPPSAPCLACSECARMISHLHRDCFFYDGLAGSIKIGDVRALRAVLGEPPREAAYRMAIFREAQALVEEAANALLKSLEEPRPGTSFVLLAPQRERLLPTLVSRSVGIALAWPREQDAAERELLAPWEEALCAFLQTGRGFFSRSGAKGAVDAPLVHAAINMCRRALVACLAPRAEEASQLQRLLARMPETRLRMLDEALAECQESLILGANSALILEWLATRMFFLLPRN